MNSKTLLIDFDGVIHKYRKGWHDGTIYDEPIEGAFEKLQMLYEHGFKLVIFSTRCDTPKNIGAVSAWFEKYRLLLNNSFWNFTFVEELDFTDKKLPALAYIDDRGIRFTNWEDIVKYFI